MGALGITRAQRPKGAEPGPVGLLQRLFCPGARSGCVRPLGRSPLALASERQFGFHRQLAAVKTAFRAYPVPKRGAPAVAAIHHVRHCGLDVRAALVATGLGYFPFGMCHDQLRIGSEVPRCRAKRLVPAPEHPEFRRRLRSGPAVWPSGDRSGLVVLPFRLRLQTVELPCLPACGSPPNRRAFRLPANRNRCVEGAG